MRSRRNVARAGRIFWSAGAEGAVTGYTVKNGEPVAIRSGASTYDESFRIRHQDRMLETGAEVEFHSDDRRGRARIMWSRYGESGFEAGLYILPEG